MKNRWIDLLLAMAFAIVFPLIVFSSLSGRAHMQKQQPTVDATTETVEQMQVPVEQMSAKITVLMEDGSVQEFLLDQYITGVVLREMPASFEIEALKAQAVVARTYALRRAQTGGKHNAASVCTSPSCCQGYYSVSQYLSDGGTQSEVDKIDLAVTETSGQVLTYDGSLIDATYFSCSGGTTEDALAVWGTDIPYLQSTESPGEEAAKYHIDTVYFTVKDFSEKLGIVTDGNSDSWIEAVTFTSGGGVDRIRICGKEFTGTEIRSILGLRSTAFTLTSVGDVVTINTKGYGHRVGMSQYGADAMAVQGSTYDEILSHYYNGTQLVEY